MFENALRIPGAGLCCKTNCKNSASTIPSLDSISTMDLTFDLPANLSNFSLDEILLEDEKDTHDFHEEKDPETLLFLEKYDKVEKFLDQEGLFMFTSEASSRRKNSGHFIQLTSLPNFRGNAEDDILNSSICSSSSLVMRRRLEAKKARSALEVQKKDGSVNSLFNECFNIKKMVSDKGMEHSLA